MWTTTIDGQEKKTESTSLLSKYAQFNQASDIAGQNHRFDTISNLWVIRYWNLNPGDTLNISGLLPHDGTPYLTGCCTETTGWYDTINGLRILVPEDLSFNDTLEVSFAADLIKLSSPPECYTSQERIKNSLRFSRTTELRLKGSQVFYSYGTKSTSGKWNRYTSPLLVNRSGILWIVNKELRKAPSKPVAIKLTRIHDFEGIKSNPLPVSPNTADQLFYLNDRDTAISPADSNTWVTWNTGNIELLFNPGMSRTLLNLSIGFIQQQSVKSSLPKKIEIWGASHSGQWECITKKRIRKIANQFCQRVSISIPTPPKEFRFYKIVLTGKAPRLSIDEIAFEFSMEE